MFDATETVALPIHPFTVLVIATEYVPPFVIPGFCVDPFVKADDPDQVYV